MRIATTQLLTPSYTNAVAGATTLNVAGGMSGGNGVLAAELALAGFTAQDNAIEEACGRLLPRHKRPKWVRAVDELPDPELALLVSSKVMYYAHPADHHR